MEKQFDKEIDAILRKVRDPDAAQSNGGRHIDADAIAAFAENAVPLQSRDGMIAHFADCGFCRTVLAKTIEINAAEPVSAEEVSTIAETAAEVPWYRRLLSPRALAYSMGIFVLAFAGVIGYRTIVLNSADETATVARVDEASNIARPESLDRSAGSPNNADLSSNLSRPQLEASATPGERAAANSNARASGESSRDRAKPGRDNSAAASADDTLGRDQPTALAAAPPPPPPAPVVSAPAARRAEAEEKAKNETSDALAESRQAQTMSLPERSPSAAAKRSAPPQDPSAQPGDVSREVSPAKRAGGKTFNNRNGVWIDSSYRGQSTTNVRRGTDAFRDLDSGLRSIAQQIGGTVIVVWKEKAYRIQ
jgi:hypothetical protein